MARTIRFHLDKNCDPRIAAGLRLHGVDVTTTPEAGLLHGPDEGQAAGQESTGITFYPAQNRSLGQVIRDLLRIWELYEPEEMRNRVEFL